ncbi:hypothetical protein ES703_92005 [subsurface metagenome]
MISNPRQQKKSVLSERLLPLYLLTSGFRRPSRLPPEKLNWEVIMSWEELKDDVGSVYSVIKWVVIIIGRIVCGCCIVSSCLESWRGIF